MFTDRTIETRGNFKPFEVIQIDNTGVYVNLNSVVLKNFSLNNYIPISGLDTPIQIYANQFIYLELKISQSLSVTGAYIRCDYVGDFLDPDDPGWTVYPDTIELMPPDVLDNSGNVILQPINQKQTRAFVPIAYTTTGTEPYSFILSTGNILGEDRFYVVQSLYNDLIMMNICRNGVPITYPFPFITPIPSGYVPIEVN